MIVHTSGLHVQPQNHDGTNDIDGAIKATKQVYDRQLIHIQNQMSSLPPFHRPTKL